MDSQRTNEYWMPVGSYQQSFDMPSDISVQGTSISGSPVSSHFDSYPIPFSQGPYQHVTEELSFPYQLPMTPSDFGSADESPYCSPPPGIASPLPNELAYGGSSAVHASVSSAIGSGSNSGISADHRTHTTSSRRRAQNRAAQRAFRERKEKHARDLESQLGELRDRYKTLEGRNAELEASYEKLRKTIELLTHADGGVASPTSADTLRKLLDILHGGVRRSSHCK